MRMGRSRTVYILHLIACAAVPYLPRSNDNSSRAKIRRLSNSMAAWVTKSSMSWLRCQASTKSVAAVGKSSSGQADMQWPRNKPHTSRLEQEISRAFGTFWAINSSAVGQPRSSWQPICALSPPRPLMVLTVTTQIVMETPAAWNKKAVTPKWKSMKMVTGLGSTSCLPR